MDIIEGEHGPKYAEGIRPAFDAKKLRVFDSAWNWGRQHTAQLFAQLHSLARNDTEIAATSARSVRHLSDQRELMVSLIEQLAA